MILQRLTCIVYVLICLSSYAAELQNWDLLYVSTNLTNHLVSFESSPGDQTTNCPCSVSDVQLVVHPTYAEVTSNCRLTNVFVNAITAKRFWTFPDSSDITLDVYKYAADIRLPLVPQMTASQTQNAETVQMMIQMWDGSNRLWEANSNAIEATFFWDLNPWRTGTYGNISVYTDNTGTLQLVDTGLSIPPDTNWHRIEFAADFLNRQFVYITADSNTADISSTEVPLVERTNWGPEVVYQITQESCATYPGAGYSNIFFWTTEFRNLEFSRLDYSVDTYIATNAIHLQWQSNPYMKYRVMSSTNLQTWTNLSGTISGDGSVQDYIPIMDDDQMYYRIELAP